jgi:hypothetical protein
MRQRFAALMIAVITAFSAAQSADEPVSYSIFWPSLYYTGIISSEHTLGVDVLLARQGAPGELNPFQYRTSTGARLNYYHYPSSAFRVGVQLGAWHQFTVADLSIPESWEIRVTPDIAWYVPVADGVLRLRGRYDIRTFLDDGASTTTMRARLQARYTIAITGSTRTPGSLYGYGFEECMIPVGSAAQAAPFVNQNRLSGGLGWVVSNAVTIEVGYVHQNIWRTTGSDELNHILELSFLLSNRVPFLNTGESEH